VNAKQWDHKSLGDDCGLTVKKRQLVSLTHTTVDQKGRKINLISVLLLILSILPEIASKEDVDDSCLSQLFHL